MSSGTDDGHGEPEAQLVNATHNIIIVVTADSLTLICRAIISGQDRCM